MNKIGETLDLDENLFDSTAGRKCLTDTVNRGINLHVVVHKNSSETLRKLGKEGKIKLFYTPMKPKPAYGHFLTDGNTTIRTRTCPEFYEILTYPCNKFEAQHDLKEFKKMEKYPIMPDGVDSVFRMISNGTEPRKIVEYLNRKM
ncbi:MAG: hypothetical protein V1802_03200 [Candidatus Aenigmatarchaeota archaeon]